MGMWGEEENEAGGDPVRQEMMVESLVQAGGMVMPVLAHGRWGCWLMEIDLIWRICWGEWERKETF